MALGIDASHKAKYNYLNVAIGANALFFNGASLSSMPDGNNTITSTKNVAVCYNSLYYNDTGHNNVAIGSQALQSNSSGFDNVALGTYAGQSNNGSSNTLIGYQSDTSTPTLQNATALGANAIVTDSNSIQLGDSNVTLVQTSGTVSATKFVGDGSGLINVNPNLSDSLNNIKVGTGALASNTSGMVNTAVGNNALTNNTTGEGNTAMGYDALSANTSGFINVAI